MITASEIDPGLILWDETVPGGAKWSGVIRRGTTLRIQDVGGSKGVSCLFYNADDTSERLNVADTAKIQFNCFLRKGRVIYSDMGRVLFSITEDTCGRHDLLAGVSNRETSIARYGAVHPNGRDNFIHALGRLGMTKRDIMPNINFFARVEVTPEGQLVHVPGASKPGDFIDLRAEMNVLTVLSNTPHVLDSSTVYDPQPVRLIAWRSGPPAEDDLCTTACPEVQRGMQNTQAWFL